MTDEVKTARADAPAAPTPPTSATGIRSRLVRLGVRGGGSGVSPALEPLLQAVRAAHPKSDLAVIERAYTVAEKAHRG